MVICAFDKIYERNYRRSFLFVKSFVHDDLVAEDIVAESLFKYWQYIHKSDKDVSDTILFTILKNASIDYLRHKMTEQTVHLEMSDIAIRDMEIQLSSLQSCDPSDIFSKEILQIVKETLETLPKQTREIFVMSRLKNKSVKEIADIQQITPKAVEYHITKTLKKLRITLKDYFMFLLFLNI